MTARCCLVWDNPLVFRRYIEDCGITSEHLTPHLMAAPFYRGNFGALIIPSGFGNPVYSCLLPALRASAGRIRRFVERGGRLLVFGAGDTRADLYDWLPLPVTYRHCHQIYRITADPSHRYASILDGYDPDAIPCDGYFPAHAGEVVVGSGDKPVMVEQTVGRGIIIVTTIHEYPSRKFLRDFCTDARETLF